MLSTQEFNALGILSKIEYLIENKEVPWGAYLRGADLSRADLSGANLSGADIRWADLTDARYSLLPLLGTTWSNISADLTLELMRWDATACGVEAMNKWAAGGSCPFSTSVRELLFQEDRSLWVPGKPTMDMLELWRALCTEKKIKQSR